jgi:hypothetical protein
MDEAFLDVTDSVAAMMMTAATSGNDAAAAAATATATGGPHHQQQQQQHEKEQKQHQPPCMDDTAVVGYIYQGRANRPCACGCRQRLALGSRLAAEMRAALKDEVNGWW